MGTVVAFTPKAGIRPIDARPGRTGAMCTVLDYSALWAGKNIADSKKRRRVQATTSGAAAKPVAQ